MKCAAFFLFHDVPLPEPVFVFIPHSSFGQVILISLSPPAQSQICLRSVLLHTKLLYLISEIGFALRLSASPKTTTTLDSILKYKFPIAFAARFR